MARVPLPKKKDYDTIRKWLIENNNVSTEELARLSCLSVDKIREWKIQCDVINPREENLFRIWVQYKQYTVAEACVVTGMRHGMFKSYLNKYGITKYKTHSRQFCKVAKRECKQMPLPKTKEELQEIMKQYGYGLIARMTGVSPSRIKNIRRKFGFRVVRDKHACDNKQWVVEHYVNRKLSLRKCAAIAGVVPHTIRNWLIKYQIVPRTLVII